MKAVSRRTGTASWSATTNVIRNVVFQIRAFRRTNEVTFNGLLFDPASLGNGASRIVRRVQSGGGSAFLTKLYHEHVSKAIL